MKVLVLTTLLPALALAASPARNISALLVPLDPEAASLSTRMESDMNEALGQFRGFSVRKPEDVLGMPMDEEAVAALKRSEQGFQESLVAFDKKDYENAEQKVRATLKEVQKAPAAMRAGCRPLCDAVALYAAIMFQRGDMEESKLAMLDLQALNPAYEMDAKRFSREVLTLRGQVATSISSALRGSAVVKTRPAGARVYVDGEFQGYSPLTVQTLRVGKHVLRLERPGFRQYGQVMEVSPDDVEVNVVMTPTEEYKAYESRMTALSRELHLGNVGESITWVGRAFQLDRGLLGTVMYRPESNTTELNLGYYDLQGGRRLFNRRVVLQGDEFGQLKSEMSRLVNTLINGGEAGKGRASLSSDPLDRTQGVEDWSAEDRGGKGTSQEKKKARREDPLDGVSGTEEW
jgi:hypothetical protein